MFLAATSGSFHCPFATSTLPFPVSCKTWLLSSGLGWLALLGSCLESLTQ